MTMVPVGEIKSCRCCGNSFTCHAKNISECHCYRVDLSDETRAYMRRKYDDCLCAECIERIKDGQLDMDL